MTQVDAARHLGFGSSTVLKKVRAGMGRGRRWRNQCRLVCGPARPASQQRRAARLTRACLPPRARPRQVMRRLGIKQWPYRKRTSAKKITCSLEVGWAAVGRCVGF